ncbi:MAG TPA: hypothetical protein VMF52_13225 [Steroidobacteraceae bacterium]|nr:hypothetical protein [Steroidobacteraceae bacterium]
MKWNVLCASVWLAFASLTAGAAPRMAVLEKSADVLAPVAKKSPRVLAPLVLAPGLVTAAAAPTVDDVGDADSFGKNVTYLGLAQTPQVALLDDCTGWDTTFGPCIVQNAAPAPTSFNLPDQVTMKLPAKATKSLLCFAITPFIDVSWVNFTATQQTARYTGSAIITIDNEVLNDPSLIDPGTGLPYGGSLTTGLSTFRTAKSIQPGAFEQTGTTQSRSCIAGLISKRALVDSYGLSDAQATQFFKKPMTLHFGSRGTVAMTDYATYFYGIRLYGD